MRRRNLALTFGLASALLPQLGCTTLPPKAPELATAEPLIFERRLDAPTSAGDKARACMSTAAALEGNAAKLPHGNKTRHEHESEAIKQYEMARQHDSRVNDRVARRLAVLYDRQGDPTKAEAEYHRALKASPKDSDLLNDYGYFLYQQSKFAEAERLLRQAVQANASNQRATVNLGMAVAQQGRTPEAFDVFTKAISPAEAHANLGYLYGTQGKRSEAIQHYRQAVQLNPNLKPARAALEWLEDPQGGRQLDSRATVVQDPTAPTSHRPSFTPTGSRGAAPEDAVARLTAFRREREQADSALANERASYHETSGAPTLSAPRGLPTVKPIVLQPTP